MNTNIKKPIKEEKKDTIKKVPLSRLVKIVDDFMKTHPKDMKILGK